MSLTFINVFSSFILDPLKFLIKSEFKLPVGTDGHTGHQSFNLKPKSYDLEDMRSVSELRKYPIEIEYSYEKAKFKYDVTTHLSIIGSRLNRVIYDHRNYSIKRYWIDIGEVWSSAVIGVWSRNRDSYLWHSAALVEIDPEQDDEVEDKTLKMLFECFNEEVFE